MSPKGRILALCCLLLLLASGAGYSQEEPAQEEQTQVENAPKPVAEIAVYSFFVNVVPESFKFPLIGFFNFAKGRHSGLEMGFLNLNTGAFSGLQMGFVNTIGGEFKGAQIGFVNTAAHSVSGLQTGFVNITGGDLKGPQIGFVNIAPHGVSGLQVGFVNTAGGDVTGPQIGFVNIAAHGVSGAQVGFVNYADSMESGVPVGFISIVRRGGYQALELYTGEVAPLNFALKLGVEKFYTAFIAGYDPRETDPAAAWCSGVGLGSIINFKHLYLNPEIRTLSDFRNLNFGLFSLNGDCDQFYTFAFNIGWKITSRINLAIGPSFTWEHHPGENGHHTFASFSCVELDNSNRFLFGGSVGIVLRLSKELAVSENPD